MADINYVDEWNFTNKHVDDSIQGKDQFLSSARSLVYAAPYKSYDKGSAPFHRIGVIQGYNHGEQRQIEMIFELGSDVPYLVPGRVTGQLSLSRILLFGKDITNLIYYGSEGKPPEGEEYIKSLKELNKPFDLMFAAHANNPNDKDPATGKERASLVYSKVFTGCWLQARNESISAGQILVAENVNIMYEDIVKATFATNPDNTLK